MKLSIEQIKTQIAEYEAKCGTEDSESVLEFFWRCYLDGKPVDDGLIRERERALDPVLDMLPVTASDALCDMVYDICEAYQRSALLEGIQIGFHLCSELSGREGQ